MKPKQQAGFRPDIIFCGSDKGGVGKSFTSALCADLLEATAGILARIVQIDEQGRLPALYGDRVITVTSPKLADLRRDPGIVVSAFDPLFSAIEKTIADQVPTIIDIGGPQQSLVEQYAGLVDLDSDLVDAKLHAVWLVPATAEPEAMRGAVRTAHAVQTVLPSITIKIVQNLRDGNFDFYPGSPADALWREQLRPLLKELGAVELPIIASGSWAPVEAAGRRMIGVVGSSIEEIQSWTGRSRPMAKVLRGDIAAFMAAASVSFGDVLGIDLGGDNE